MAPQNPIQHTGGFSETLLRELAPVARGLHYGQIVITVHGGRIVQIDKTEKVRFDVPSYTKSPLEF